MNRGQRDALVREACFRLREEADPERAEQALVYFPSRPPILGAPSGLGRELGKRLGRRIKAQGSLEDAIAVADGVFRSGVLEESACANEILALFWREFGPDDWELFERWIDGFTSWGTTDSFCLKVLSHLVLRDGPPMDRLRIWVLSDCLWRRRAALACMVRVARKGLCQAELFELLDSLLADPEDLVQKAIGWILNELSRGDAEATIGYVGSHLVLMTRISQRRACEKLTPAQRRRALGS